jgi:hypothetical protein
VHIEQAVQVSTDDDTLEMTAVDLNETVEQVLELVVQEVCTSFGLEGV